LVENKNNIHFNVVALLEDRSILIAFSSVVYLLVSMKNRRYKIGPIYQDKNRDRGLGGQGRNSSKGYGAYSRGNTCIINLPIGSFYSFFLHHFLL
jgi:hypothetical protein